MSSPADLPTLAAFEARFDSVLRAGPHGYFAGGAGDELTLRRNAEAWQELEVHPSVMVDVSKRDPAVTVLGIDRPHPILVAPTAYHRLAHPRGEPETARGAAAAGAVYTLSTLATARPNEVEAGSPGSPKWFQVYVFRDRGVTDALVDEAAESGFEALVVTADLPVLGRRDRDLVSGFEVGNAELVPGVAAAGANGIVSMQDTADLIDPSLTWSDIESFAASSDLPVLVKGVLRPEDARRAVDSGAAGVIVSNHGGRQLDTSPATADVLPAIREALGQDATVLVDGGIRRGTDILKGLALGADAVMLGRPILWGLASSGSTGVMAVIEILLDEFDRSLALAGCPTARDLAGREALVRPRSTPRY